jgi:hypothetical protein
MKALLLLLPNLAVLLATSSAPPTTPSAATTPGRCCARRPAGAWRATTLTVTFTDGERRLMGIAYRKATARP